MSYEKHKEALLNKYPAISDLEERAKKRIPRVAWEYLQTGTGREELIRKNLKAMQKVVLRPRFCKGPFQPDLRTQLFGRTYHAPFGIAPIGLCGLMWPEAELILANTARRRNIPYALSTVATETPEAVGPHAGDMGWFQLYPPRKKELRKILLDRARQAGFHTLLVTADVPTPSRRERTKRAGLSTPPKMTPAFLWQGITHPVWSYHTLRRGLPRLRTIEAYSEFKNMMSVGAFVQSQFRGNLSWEYCQELKAEWDGPVVLKGLLHPADAEKAVSIGLDGIIVSNHGGRQFDGAPPSIDVLPEMVRAVKGKTAVLFDSGIRSGLDILRALHLGADFVLAGRAFMYGVAALGRLGGEHASEILLSDLENNMIQLGVRNIQEIKSSV